MTREIPVTQARAELAELVTRVGYRGERILLTRHGRPLAALVPVEDLEALDRRSGGAGLPPLAEGVPEETERQGGAVPIGFGRPRTGDEDPESAEPPGGPLRVAAEHREHGRSRREC